ncbi:hypothetical protein ACTXT7_007974 [Hymenolepis weldensis]
MYHSAIVKYYCILKVAAISYELSLKEMSNKLPSQFPSKSLLSGLELKTWRPREKDLVLPKFTRSSGKLEFIRIADVSHISLSESRRDDRHLFRIK